MSTIILLSCVHCNNSQHVLWMVIFVSVKLRPLRHLEEVSYTSMSVQLNWSEPEGYDPKWFDVVYELQCEGPWKDEPKVSDPVTCGDVCCEGRPCVGVTFTCTLSRFAGDFWQTKLVTSGFSLRSMSHNKNYRKITLRVIISVVVSQSIGQHALIVQSVSCEIVTHP